MNAHTEPRLPAIAGGGSVVAIIPQTFEDTWRVARAVLRGGLAPAALVGKLEGEDAVSAIAVAIMSGAELGLKPMVALRSFTVINGKPALYGDGLINVVRQSGRVQYLRTGCDVVGGKMVGFCEAKRSDTGEEKRVEFSQDDAIRAGLWSPASTKRGQVWRNGSKVWVDDAPNDSPWHRYPQRMLAWRAAGYCLRELFGDVLGGIRDEFEVREIEGEFIEHEPTERVLPPSPPSPPSPDEASSQSEAAPPSPPSADTGEQPFSIAAFLTEIDEAMALGKTEDEIIEIWDGYDVEATLTDDERALQRAFDLRKRHFERAERAELAKHPINGG